MESVGSCTSEICVEHYFDAIEAFNADSGDVSLLEHEGLFVILVLCPNLTPHMHNFSMTSRISLCDGSEGVLWFNEDFHQILCTIAASPLVEVILSDLSFDLLKSPFTI